MADFLKQLAAVRAAGYVVVDQGGGRWAFNAPNGSCSVGHSDETTAWAKAVFHHKKAGGAERAAKPWAVFGLNVSKYGRDNHPKTPDRWKIGRIVRETDTRLYTEARVDSSDHQPKASLVARFATEGEAKQFLNQALAAVRAEQDALTRASEACRAADEARRDAERALNTAVRNFVNGREG